MVELCFNQSAQGALKMAQHCGGKGRHSVGIAFCTSEDGEKPSRRAVRARLRKVRAEQDRLDRYAVPLGNKSSDVLCLGLALALGVVGWAPKWPDSGWLWLINNALLVTLAEEALFRGYVQQRLARCWRDRPWGATAALLVAALLFGLAHYAGGWQWVLLAGVAGVAYGLAYRHGGLAAAVLAHLGLNAAHYGLFTYPMRAALH